MLIKKNPFKSESNIPKNDNKLNNTIQSNNTFKKDISENIFDNSQREDVGIESAFKPIFQKPNIDFSFLNIDLLSLRNIDFSSLKISNIKIASINWREIKVACLDWEGMKLSIIYLNDFMCFFNGMDIAWGEIIYLSLLLIIRVFMTLPIESMPLWYLFTYIKVKLLIRYIYNKVCIIRG